MEIIANTGISIYVIAAVLLFVVTFLGGIAAFVGGIYHVAACTYQKVINKRKFWDCLLPCSD